MKLTKQQRRFRIKKKIRGRVSGSSERPRLCVYRSNNHIYAQFIDDSTGKTLAQVSSKTLTLDKDLNKVQISEIIGSKIAEKAKDINVDTVCFDRNGYLYHGRVKALAEAARQGGLKF